MQRWLRVTYMGKKPELPWASVERSGLGLAELSACPTDPRWGLGSVCSEPDTAGAGKGLLWKRENRQMPGSRGTHLCSQFVIPEQNPGDKKEHEVYWSCLGLKLSREMSCPSHRTSWAQTLQFLHERGASLKPLWNGLSSGNDNIQAPERMGLPLKILKLT